MNRLNKTESAIFISLMCSFLPEDLHSGLILIYHDYIQWPVLARSNYIIASVNSGLSEGSINRHSGIFWYTRELYVFSTGVGRRIN